MYRGKKNLKIENILSVILILSVNWEEVTNSPWPSLWTSAYGVPYLILGLERTFSFLFFNFPSKLWLLSMECLKDNTWIPPEAGCSLPCKAAAATVWTALLWKKGFFIMDKKYVPIAPSLALQSLSGPLYLCCMNPLQISEGGRWFLAWGLHSAFK